MKAESGKPKAEQGDASPALNLPLDCLWSIEDRSLAGVIEHLRAAGTDAAAMTRRVEIAGPMTFDPDTGVAEIQIVGVMSQRTGFWSWLYGGCGSIDIAESVAAAAKDPRVIAILLSVDSPGGQARGVPELADAIFAARKAKPVYAHVNGMCASAALWAASQAEKIFAGRMDEIGSIGTRMMLFDTSRLYANEGVSPVLITTGDYKAIGVAGVPITDAQQEHLREYVNTWNEEFLAAVSRGRGLSLEKVRELADGRTFFAPQAVEKRLIDGVQSKADTLAQLAERAKKPPTPRRLPMSTTPVQADATPAPAPVATPAAPQPATVAQLKAACPKATAEWRETQLESGATLDQAKGAYIKFLEDASAAAEAKHKQELEAAAKKAPAAQAPGAEPLSTKPREREAGGDAVAEFDAAVTAEMDRSKCSRHEAHRRVCQKQPELREAMVAAHNAQHEEARIPASGRK